MGGSNFGIRSDNPPDWGSTTSPNIASGLLNADATLPPPQGVELDPNSTICPISGTGKDAETPAVDTWNEVTPGVFNYLADIDGFKSVPAAPTVGKTIADQLVDAGMTWKTYQESLPLGTVFGVNTSNGTVSNLSDFSTLAPITSKNYVQEYAVKHNPFAYFQNVQDGTWDNNSLENVVGFDGPRGLYADLARGDVPNFSFVVPNQCDDQHGRSPSATGEDADMFCAYDPGLPPGGVTAGTTAGLNPGLIQQGDVTIERIVRAIHASPVWQECHTAIVIVWDENDYSGLPNQTHGVFPRQNQNTVVLTVELNNNSEGVQSKNYYNSYSLLKSLEAAFGLPCLNHSCDPGVAVMSDLFGGHSY